MDFPGHFQHIFQQLNYQRLHAQLCDCVVTVGDRSFQAHRSILAACSSHFRALLSSGNSSDGGGQAVSDRPGGPGEMVLDPEVVTPEAFSTLLDMIYTSTLSLGASNVMDVLLAASHLHLNAVVKACKLHLSRQNFPALPPKGWRSVQQQSLTLQGSGECSLVTSAMEEDLEEEGDGVEVSQSGSVEDEGIRARGDGGGGEWSAAPTSRHKRKSHKDMSDDRKRSCRMSGENCRERSPTVTRSINIGEEGNQLMSPDSLKVSGAPWQSQSEEEVEEKYEATKGELEEVQLPSQSDSSTGGMCQKNGDGENMVKVKMGDEFKEEGEEQKMAVIDVKKEHLSSFSSDLEMLANNSPPSPSDESSNRLESQMDDEKIPVEKTPALPVISLKQLSSDLHTDVPYEVEDVREASVDGECLDSLSELAFSCFLNPSSESVMGALTEEVTTDALTAAATAAATAADAPSEVESCPNTDKGNASHSSDSASSFVFPVTSVPLQQLLPTQSPGFSDTLILQPTQSSAARFVTGITPGFGLDASLVQPSKVGKTRGCGGSLITFRRIAPKVLPGSETSTNPDPSSASAVDAVDRPSLTRASEDVLFKCKKAASEDHVLLVEGEKKYACKICCKTFMNLTDCKKHIRVHTGEKPYPCPKCGKRFSQSSHLYKHCNTCQQTDTLL
ncbi:zinc finger and BTB domain-containing protein 5-like [Thalassophryne amazonica]|uniref:zinc finger and BTB domain-containing protein 5-like n=1 Tax=Thalassophryne amazonica TaxID=390379 RepID=UPI0014714A9F|nr:zinc finger and BTB domain-containing protein 5-like [Thalassophryne amazonica]